MSNLTVAVNAIVMAFGLIVVDFALLLAYGIPSALAAIGIELFFTGLIMSGALGA